MNSIITEEIKSKILDLWNQKLSNRKIALNIGYDRGVINKFISDNGLKPNGLKKRGVDFIDENNAKCKCCNQVKTLDNFIIYKNYRKHTMSYCKECRKKQQKIKRESSNLECILRRKYKSLVNRAKKKNIALNINEEYFFDLYKKQNGKCFYTNIDMIYKSGLDGPSRNSMSIDKIIPEKGYTKGNIVFCSHRINTIKSNLSLKEMEEWFPIWHQLIIDKFEKDQKSPSAT
jgi:hypothetical protein